MYLITLYSEPAGRFPPIEFKNGINIIFGKKDSENDPKNSLNGIGKSLALDLMDFCLLSSFSKDKNKRLYDAKNLLTGYYIVLEFEVEGQIYILKRSTDHPNKDIKFGTTNHLENYSLKELNGVLCNLIFQNKEYRGQYSSSWFRRLISFFVKIEKTKKSIYTDPIKYLKDSKIMELNQYHLFLMGMDNTLVSKNYAIQTDLSGKEKAIREIKNFVNNTYKLDNISTINSEIDSLKRQIHELEDFISSFKLEKSYIDAEEQANNLTSEIKKLWYENYTDKKKIDAYKASYDLDLDVDAKKIHRLYKELNVLLANNIRKKLDEAIDFRRLLSKSRKDFLSQEVTYLESLIEERNNRIESLEDERAKLFSFLANKKAIRDLSEAYLLVSQKRDLLSDLESKVRIFNDLTRTKLELKSQDALLSTQVYSFLNNISKEVAEFRSEFRRIYDSIYVENKDKSIFDIEFIDSINKIEFKITFPAMESKGKNRGRTLIYDLSILFNAINKNIHCPRFLIHDGIFDGMDKAHFVQLYEFIERMKSEKRFQYIVTLNEEGTLNQKFGDVEQIHPDKISQIAILVLSPKNKLLGEDF